MAGARFPAFLYLLLSRESRRTSSLLETIQKRRKTFPCVQGLIGCLYGRRDGTFLSRVYKRMFLPWTISPGTICKVSIISSRRSGTECLYDKNCPALAGIPVERTGIPLCRDGTKNIPAKFFPYKRNFANNNQSEKCDKYSSLLAFLKRHENYAW